MARIMAFDLGGKRTGIAVTDPLQLIATGLTTIDSHTLLGFVKEYLKKEEVERFVVGWPTNWDDSPTHGTVIAEKGIALLAKHFPQIPIVKVDERYTSKLAKDAMLEMGLKKKDRRDKKIVDEIAATILLQDYLRSIQGT
ncbi:MAG: Holliday junction resolvase RuvX [Chitinophagaceae bacterium]|nr:Holliday junction resolvase RuvX [Chitinophagaceae bacterium]